MRESSGMWFGPHKVNIKGPQSPPLQKNVLKMLSGHKLSYQVDIAELIEPEVVDGGGDGWEVIGLEASVTETNCRTQPRQNPPV